MLLMILYYMIPDIRLFRSSFELELIQKNMTQKPVTRVEVGALGARQVKNVKRGGWAGKLVLRACVGACGCFSPGWTVWFRQLSFLWLVPPRGGTWSEPLTLVMDTVHGLVL